MRTSSLCILLAALLLPACASFPGSASPTPRLTPTATSTCVNITWSVDSPLATKLQLTPDLLIIIDQESGNMIHDPATGEYVPGSSHQTTTITADGRAVWASATYFQKTDQLFSSQDEKQLTPAQLEQIFTLFNAANFLAITYGCNGKMVQVTDVGMLRITLASGVTQHTIEDHGACAGGFAYPPFCDLPDQLGAITGPWQP